MCRFVYTASSQTSGEAKVLQDIHTEVGGIPYTYALESSSEEEDNDEEDLEDLLAIQDAITSDQYLQSRDSAGRHDLDIHKAYIFGTIQVLD